MPASPSKTLTKNKQSRKKKLKFETIFLSDIHLGSPDAKLTQVIHFLRNSRCKKLILNGDIIDGWSLSKRGKWSKSCTYFVRLVLKKIEKEGTQIIYTRGNHDDVLWKVIPVELENLKVVNEYIHETPQGNYLVVHGDGFDSLTTNHRWVAKIGAVGYELLLWVNRWHGRWRGWRGKSPYSVSKIIKSKVKSAVTFMDRYEEQLQEFSKLKDCVGVIAGHIHSPANHMIGDTHYLNSGDWVESLSAVVEHSPGDFELIDYHEFCQRSKRKAKAGTPSRDKRSVGSIRLPEESVQLLSKQSNSQIPEVEQAQVLV